jgi:hypothetical protein
MEDNIYCECSSCGESGCCSPFLCLSKLFSQSETCKFGDGYIKELKISWEFSEWVLSEVTEKHSLSEKEINQKYQYFLDKYLFANNE